MSIGKFAQSLIISRPELKNAELLELVKAEFPQAKTSMACIAWYKSDLKKKAKLAPAVVELTLEQKIEAQRAKLQQLQEDAIEAEIELEAMLEELAKQPEVTEGGEQEDAAVEGQEAETEVEIQEEVEVA